MSTGSEAKVQESINKLNDNVSYAEYVLQYTIDSYCKDLDAVMAKIQEEVVGVDSPALVTIEKYFVELSGVLYTVCDKVEKLGVYDSISKSQAQETYNTKYLETANPSVGKKPTVGEIQSTAEVAATYDVTVNTIYSKAYRAVKNKVAAAETMVATLSKIYSHRMQESQMTTNQLERKILNEEDIFRG